MSTSLADIIELYKPKDRQAGEQKGEREEEEINTDDEESVDELVEGHCFVWTCLDLDEDFTERDILLNTKELFGPVYDKIDEVKLKYDDESAKHMEIHLKELINSYSGAKWVPLGFDSKAQKKIVSTLKEWEKSDLLIFDPDGEKFCDELYEIEEDPANSDNIKYMCFRHRKIYVDVIFKKSCLKFLGIYTDKKIYFWRGSFPNTKRGLRQAKVMKNRMLLRCNLFYRAASRVYYISFHILSFDLKQIPLLLHNRTLLSEDNIEKHPEWVFIQSDDKYMKDVEEESFEKLDEGRADIICLIFEKMRIEKDAKETKEEKEIEMKQVDENENAAQEQGKEKEKDVVRKDEK